MVTILIVSFALSWDRNMTQARDTRIMCGTHRKWRISTVFARVMDGLEPGSGHDSLTYETDKRAVTAMSYRDSAFVACCRWGRQYSRDRLSDAVCWLLIIPRTYGLTDIASSYPVVVKSGEEAW